MSDAYVGLGAREGSAKGDHNIAGRLSLMEALVPLRGKRFLDLGCGNGAYTIFIARTFDSGVGVDIEPDRLGDFRAALVAAGIEHVEVLECSATSLPYPDSSFDVVTAIETMEHLGRYREDTLAETARVLAAGGTFYLTTPNRLWPFEQHGFEFRGKRQPGWRFPFLTWIPPLHRRLSPDDAFLPGQLDRLIEPHGFRRTGLAFMLPPLDGHPRLRRRLKGLFGLIGKTPLRRFGQTLVMTYERVPTA